MSVLADSAIHERLRVGESGLPFNPDWRLIVRPMMDNAVQPASVDVRLGPVIKITQWYGPRSHMHHHLIDEGPYMLGPGTFILAATLEWVEIPTDLVAILVGKSTRARQGLCVEDAGYIDPGYKGNVTIELSNRSPRPVVLTNGMPIAQIRFETLEGPCLRPYGTAGLGSHYQDSVGAVEAREG